MSKVIIYKNPEGNISVLYPSGELPLDDVALKDVPAETSYKIIDSSEVPPTREGRSEWNPDFKKPDGKGIGYDAWIKIQADIVKATADD